MNLTHNEYELLVETLTIALRKAERAYQVLEDGHQALLREHERDEVKIRELKDELKAAETVAELLRGDLEQVRESRSTAAKKANAKRRADARMRKGAGNE